MHHRTPHPLAPLAGLLAVMMGGTGCSRKAVPPPQPEVAVLPVVASRVQLSTELPGRVSASLVAEVHAQVNGIIIRRAFTEGADVKAGDLLYQIDPAPYQAALATAEAAYARAQANLPSLRNRMDRNKGLVSLHAVSQQDLDDSIAAFQQGEADVKSSRAALDAARINLAYTRITAPISGRTGKSNVTVGALASAYQGAPFTTIQQLDPVFVDAPESSDDLLRMKRMVASGRIRGAGEGMAKVALRLEDGTAYAQAGTLKFSDVTVDPSTGSVNLRMTFPNPGHVLLPGMYARVVVADGVADSGILVPQQGVTHNSKGEAVALVVNGGKVEQRILKIERAVGNRWLVAEGLGAGDQLIMEGLQQVRPGMAVRVVPFHETAESAAN